jgi:hypothetical protein
MYRYKTILILITSLIGILVLSACGAGSAPEPAATQAPQSADESAPTPEVAEPTEAPEEPATEAPAEAPAEAQATVSFVEDVFPILESRCYNCHGGQRVEEGLLLGSYEELMAGSENGPVIVPGDAENSLLVEEIVTQEMPKRGPKLTPPQVQLIIDWVNSGAPNN